MLLFWIVTAAVVYFLLLGMVLLFFASVGKLNERWDGALHEVPPRAHRDDEFLRAA